jgi:hypothetical protein
VGRPLLREDRVSGYSNNEFDSEGFEPEDNTGRGLRAQLEKALEEIATLKKNQQKTTATEVLKNAGIDPALADLVPKDSDPAEWVAQYGPLLGARPKTLEEEKVPAAEHIEVPAEEDDAVRMEREARAAMEGAAGDGSASVYSTDVLERMNKIDSEEELMKFFNSNGAQ